MPFSKLWVLEFKMILILFLLGCTSLIQVRRPPVGPIAAFKLYCSLCILYMNCQDIAQSVSNNVSKMEIPVMYIYNG